MMKTFKSIMYIAAAAMAFTACNVEPIEALEETIVTHTVTFVASQLDTKTTMDINNGVASFDWEEADKAYFHIFENGVGVSGEDVDAELVDKVMTISAVFPESSAPYTYTGFMATTISNDNPAVSSEQIDLGAYDPESDILVAMPVVDKTPEDILEGILFQFKRVVAINKMTLKGLTAGETITKVAISSDKAIAGEYDFTKGEWNASATSIEIEAESVANDNGEAVIYFVSAPVEEAQLTITATTAAGKTYSKQLAKTITFSEGGVKTFGVTVENATPVEESYIELTNDEIGDMESSYAGGTIHNSYGDWSYNACKQSRDGYTFMQIRNNETVSFIQIPEVAGDITRIVLSDVCNGSNSKYTGDVYFRTNKSNSADVIAQSNSATKAFDELTIELSNSYSTGYVMSSGSCRFTKIRVYYSTIKKTALATPTNLAVTNKVITWDAVTNAGSYLVTIGTNDPVKANTNSYDATAIADEYYDVSVVAVPSNTDIYKKSAPAVLEGVKFGDPWLTQPTLSAGAIDESSITVTWTNDPRATNGYEAIIYKDLGDGTLGSLTTTDHDQMNIMTGSATFTGLEEGQAYEIRVMAMPVTEPRAYHFSSNGTINLATRAAQHVSDVTEAGNYTIKGLTVYASNGSNQSVLGDGTGFILDYGSKRTVGHIYTISGNVESYRGVWEFSNATGTKTGETQGDVIYPTPIDFTASEATSYITNPYINYVHFSGKVDASTGYISVGDVNMNVYNTSKGKTYDVLGFTIGYKEASYISVMPVSLTDVTPTLSVSPTSKTWKFNETDGVTFNVSSTNGAWTVTPTTIDWATVAVDATAGTITVTPKGQNASDADYEATLTVSHSVDATLTETITLKQSKESEGGQGGDDSNDTTILSEEFDNTTDSDSSKEFDYTKFSNFSGATAKAYTSKYGGVKLGTSSAAGYITSKSLDLSKSFTVSLNVLKYGTDTGIIEVTVGSVKKTITPTITDTVYSLDFDAATSSSTIKIATTSKRAYIDNVVVVRHD